MASGIKLNDQLGFELFELLPDAILAVDRRGIIRYANRQAGQMFGLELAALVSTPFKALLPDNARQRNISHRKYTSDLRTWQPLINGAMKLFGGGRYLSSGGVRSK